MSGLYCIMYHFIRPVKNSRYPELKALEYDVFVDQLAFLKENFHFVTMEEVVSAYEEEKALPEKAVLLTFDDGYADWWQYVYPLLYREGIQGSFFVCAEAVCDRRLMEVNRIQLILASGEILSIMHDLNRLMDEYRRNGADLPAQEILFDKYAVGNRLDSREIIYVKRLLQTVLPKKIREEIARELFQTYVGISETVMANELYVRKEQLLCMRDNGMHIGVHGYEHLWLGKEQEDEIRLQIDTALEKLGDCIDRSFWTMSYPFGSYNTELISYIEKKGCRLGFLSEVGRSEISKEERYKIVRYDTVDFPPISTRYAQDDWKYSYIT